jgi:hypothetical protein
MAADQPPFELVKRFPEIRHLFSSSHLPAFVQTTRAAITPGTHPHKVSSATINIVPQPLSNTANGGKRMQIKALPKPMVSSPSYNAS